MPRLSFVVPVYRKNHILPATIKALCEQSLKEWEAVFVLDGPDDEAKAIIRREMKKKPNHFIIVETEHGGACAARNAGFAHTSGDYVVFWDADCMIECHASQAWVDMLDKHPEAAFVYSGYKFLGEAGAINAELWDPWLLRVRNFVSSCFPVRRDMAGVWDVNLQSLQDWDFWLQVLEKAEAKGMDPAKLGKYMQGYAFSTELPTPDSISGKGCTPEVWMERVNAVKRKHGLPFRDVCVSSLAYKSDGIALAKLIGADYQDYPTAKPHDYKTIVQLGFSTKPDRVEAHAANFNDPKTRKVLFWMPDNIHEVFKEISFEAIVKYRTLLNSCAEQFVEDQEAADLMKLAGFQVAVMPVPMVNDKDIKPYPNKPRFIVDVGQDYGKILSVIDKSLPDIELEVLTGAEDVNDYCGLVHFYPDRTTSPTIKKALLTGRHVISNVQAPFCGYISDRQAPEAFVVEFVNKIRTLAKSQAPADAVKHYRAQYDAKNLLEVLK